LAVLKLPNPRRNKATTPTEINKYPNNSKLRHRGDDQSALKVFSPEKIYQSNSKLIADMIKNTLKKTPLCM
jgi:hypothetical protein